MLGLQTPSCRELELAWRKLHGRKNWVPCAIFACVPSHKLKRPKGGRSYFLQIPVSYSSTHKHVFRAKKVPVSVNQIPKSPVQKSAISSSLLHLQNSSISGLQQERRAKWLKHTGSASTQQELTLEWSHSALRRGSLEIHSFLLLAVTRFR